MIAPSRLLLLLAYGQILLVVLLLVFGVAWSSLDSRFLTSLSWAISGQQTMVPVSTTLKDSLGAYDKGTVRKSSDVPRKNENTGAC